MRSSSSFCLRITITSRGQARPLPRRRPAGTTSNFPFLPAAKRTAEEIAELAGPAPWRWRLAVWIALVGIPIVRVKRTLIGAICRTPIRPFRAVPARAFRDGRGFNPARSAAIGILHLHPAWLARDHPHLPARGKRVNQRRLHRGL